MRSGTRIVNIDAMRFIASIAVIPLHATDTPDPVRQGCRFAVPFFFFISGYFLGRRDFQKPWSIIRTLFVRLFPVIIVWLGVFW